MSSITRELPVPPRPADPPDPTLFKPSEAELDFLKKTVSESIEEIRRRVVEAQTETYEHYPYPCIRAFHFTNLIMSSNPIYPSVLDAGKQGNTYFLDLGCCMGTDVRKLVLDGYPGNNVAGCDLRRTFIDAGYKLFGDKASSAITFLTGDIFELPLQPAVSPSLVPFQDVTALDDLKGRLSHIYAGALFHLFNEDTQYAIAIRLALLLKDGPGGIIFGRHQGKEEAGVLDDGMGRERYGHNVETWTGMWKKVFTELKGEDLVTNHLIVDARFMAVPLGTALERRWLFWSVSIV